MTETVMRPSIAVMPTGVLAHGLNAGIEIGCLAAVGVLPACGGHVRSGVPLELTKRGIEGAADVGSQNAAVVRAAGRRKKGSSKLALKEFERRRLPSPVERPLPANRRAGYRPKGEVHMFGHDARKRTFDGRSNAFRCRPFRPLLTFSCETPWHRAESKRSWSTMTAPARIPDSRSPVSADLRYAQQVRRPRSAERHAG